MCCEKNTTNRILSNTHAFTLIEVMLVVGVLAILAGLAIANYSVYEAKARQGEAKIALAGIFSAERSFKGEWSAYIEDFQAIGYQPEGFKRHYTVGWKIATVPNAVTGYTGGIGIPFYDYVNVPTPWGYNDAGTVAICDITNARGGLTDATALAPDVNPQAYVVKARGVIRKGQPCDEWQIDEQRNLRNMIIAL